MQKMQTPCHFSCDAPNLRVWITGNHAEGKRIANGHFREAARPRVGKIDCAVIAAQSTEEAAYFAAKVQGRLVEQGKLWIILNDPGERIDAACGKGSELGSGLVVHGYRWIKPITPCHGLVCIAFVYSTHHGADS